MNISRPVILGIAKGGEPQDLRAFVLSLRNSGYAGDVCLFVDDLTPEVLGFLHDNRIQLVAFPQRYFTQTRRYFLRIITDLLKKPMRANAKISFAQYYLKLVDARWACYFDFLRATRGLYSHVMFTDVKDVIFQREPFDFEWKSPFCTFYETPGFFIKDEGNTSGWIEEGYGAQEARNLGDKRIVCAGATFAEFDSAMDYLEIMCRHLIKINARGLVDQGVHNYLLHHQLIKNFHIYDYPETPVLHLGLTAPDKLELNEQGLVINGSGRVANVVHQYFQHRKALAPCLKLITAPR